MSTVAVHEVKQSTGVIKWLREHPLAGYFIFAFAGSWLVWLPAVLGKGGLGLWPIVPPATLLGVCGPFAGPLLAAFIMAAIVDGKAGVHQLLQRMGQWRVGFHWYVFVLIGVPLIVASGLTLLGGGMALGAAFAAALAKPEDALSIGLAWLINLVVYFFVGGPLGEEPGWRGFALPRLQQAHGGLIGSLILGLLWFAWHLPMFLVPAINPSGRGTAATPEGILTFAALILAFSIIFTWVFNNTRGSVLLAILLHTAMNTTTGNLRILVPDLADFGLALLISFGTFALLLIVLTKGHLSFPSRQ